MTNGKNISIKDKKKILLSTKEDFSEVPGGFEPP